MHMGASWLFGSAIEFIKPFHGGLLLASHLKKDLGRPAFLAALPPAQWLCDGSSPRQRRGGLWPCAWVDVLSGMCTRVRVYVHDRE